MEKRFAYKFLKRLLKYIDSAQEFIAHLGECVAFLNPLWLNTNGCFTLIQSSFPTLTLTLIFVVDPEAMATSGKTDKSPHDQEIKFFAKVWKSVNISRNWTLKCQYVDLESHSCISSLQVLLPLTDQTFKNHCLYFLSTPSKNLSICGCAANKEKEMVTR